MQRSVLVAFLGLFAISAAAGLCNVGLGERVPGDILLEKSRFGASTSLPSQLTIVVNYNACEELEEEITYTKTQGSQKCKIVIPNSKDKKRVLHTLHTLEEHGEFLVTLEVYGFRKGVRTGTNETVSCD